ncbi:MAG: hypothetical protein DSO07_01100 [Thermoproteota archaeon]|uniref:Uncharacterized protein n=1 Tax=Candidatus Methanodesulfokora washburnensis TaxID=2478471 RepID=A0A429GGP7_9CREN|nr:hypothetical protein [Candidatus Methanodesulfokores washburnensis]RSN72974.1 hypothetical protein D6D85_11830 [Candidatus Methanodesulfokores washburnensis]TDA42112.1 MAG: hypothetical protein DSO07_01100 [Candidatus Korarchaeota archaeon]
MPKVYEVKLPDGRKLELSEKQMCLVADTEKKCVDIDSEKMKAVLDFVNMLRLEVKEVEGSAQEGTS